MLVTRTFNNQEIHYDTIAPAIVSPRASVFFRSDAGNVGAFINVDGATEWQQLMQAGGSVTFSTTTDAAWTLRGASAASLVIGSAALPGMLTFDTTLGAEAVAAGSRLTTTDGVTAGTDRIVGGRVAENPAVSADVSDTHAVFSTGTHTIPANSFKVGTVLHFEALIAVTAVSGGAPTAQIRVFLGGVAGTLVFDTTALNVAAGVAVNNFFILKGRLVCRAAGAVGTLTGVLEYSLGAVNAAPGTVGKDVAGSVAGTYTAAIDTTVANTFDVTGVTDAAATTIAMQDFHCYMEA